MSALAEIFSAHGGLSKPMIAAVLGLVAFVCLRQAWAGMGLFGKPIPRVRANALMTNAERRVIVYIEQALPDARIHAQVSMGAILRPALCMDPRTATITRNRFSSKRVDFVAEDRATGAVIAIIELDDWSHNHANDTWRDRLTARAGYTTIRLPAGERHTPASVRARIEAGLSRGRTPPFTRDDRRNV